MMKILMTLLILTAVLSTELAGQEKDMNDKQSSSVVIKLPHMASINDVLIDQTEILNIHWLEYLHFRSLEVSEDAYQQLLPDSNNFWFRDPVHRYQPIVYVSYHQALDYCKWRSKVISERYGIQVTYRLPTASEWEGIAKAVAERDEKKVIKNLKKQQKIISKGGDSYFLSSRSLDHPENKVIDLFSNASEMVAKEGIAKGMNHKNLNSDGDLLKTVRYTKPNAYLGFRCVAEITIDELVQYFWLLKDQKKVSISLDSLNSTDIPSEIGLLEKVEELNISLTTEKSRWTVLPPLSWYRNRELKPPFRKLPASIGNLKELKSITANHLDIHHLPDSFYLKHLNKLQYVDLSFNKLDLNKAVPILLQVPNLKVLKVIGNKYDAAIMERYRKQYPNVELVYQISE
ncbi:MAG: SUMF1/EgtB/PvdO family nonheme iron enzyme [Bacteroidota bacterium]